MDIDFRIQRYVVERGSLSSLKAALKDLQHELRSEGVGDTIETKAARILCDQAAAFNYLLGTLPILDLDAQIIEVRKTISDVFEKLDITWNRFLSALTWIEGRLASLESLLVDVPNPFDELLRRSFPRHPLPITLVHEVKLWQQSHDESLSVGAAQILANAVLGGLKRDLERYLAMLPFGDSPPDQRQMQVREGQLGEFIETLTELKDSSQLREVREQAEALLAFQEEPDRQGRKSVSEIFMTSVGRLPIWGRISETDLWKRLEPYLANEMSNDAVAVP